MIPELKVDPPTDICGISLFGSAARGDQDQGSDIDILMLIQNAPLNRVIELRNWCADALSVPHETVSPYTLEAARAMASSGSLLLWHLKLEGRLIFQRQDAIDSLLETLKPFADYNNELDLYDDLVADVTQAWVDNRGPTELDLHVLQVVVRNACILLTVFQGRPTFGRISAVEEAKRQMPNLPVDMDAYRELSVWHLLFLRGYCGKTPTLPPDPRVRYLDMARSVVMFVRAVTR
jgi:predicted nucleotidyltransferase